MERRGHVNHNKGKSGSKVNAAHGTGVGRKNVDPEGGFVISSANKMHLSAGGKGAGSKGRKK